MDKYDLSSVANIKYGVVLEYAKKLKLMESWVPRKDDVT
jgi:hypothetical protein